MKDVLQDVFLRLHQSLGTLNRADRLASWLFQIFRNSIADYYRASGRRREIPTESILEPEADPEADMDTVHSSIATNPLDSDAHRAKVVEELSSCLRPMIHHLPVHYRDAITLVELEGATQREAAERIGVSVSGMKSRVQRGRQMLKRMLHDCCQIHLSADGRIADYAVETSSCVHCMAKLNKR